MRILTIISLIFSLFTISVDKILIKETIYIDSLNLNQDELTNLIITKYKLPYGFETTEIYSDYFNKPSYNQIYSVELIINYKDNPTLYNFKLIVNNPNQNNYLEYIYVLPITFFLLIILFSIYKYRTKN